MHRFTDIKNGIQQILADPNWPVKILLGGFLLINPFLVALAPTYFSTPGHPWIPKAFPWLFLLNLLSFWFPLGFTFEVLRRARTGQGRQLPDWSFALWRRYAREGAVKLVLAVTTLILPVSLWMGLVYWFFIHLLELPVSLLSPLAAPMIWLAIPFCSVACCRWLDGVPMYNCALNYPENWRIFRRGQADYLVASAFLMGVNAIANSLFYTIPFATVFGLCLVDTWFGPIYAEIVKSQAPPSNSSDA